jgi:hypothetical protein
MARSGKKDPKLSEVKEVLQRLQGLPGESEPDGARAAGNQTRSAPRLASVATAAIIFVSAAGIFGAAYVFVGIKGPEKSVPPLPSGGTPPVTAGTTPPRADLPKAPAVKAALEGARALMSKGRVRAAREHLLALAEQGSPDAAWDLARSYDPSVLVALAAADAGPDIKEATRWYRAWYAAAVHEGLVADSVSLERIIGSMQR